MPKVSVIIPVYGVEKYIERCAISLFEQTLDDIEFIFVDDCTPDRSIDILKSIIDKYPSRKSQIRIFKMLSNSGQAAVRQQGMKLATGDYIIHCDSDDWVAQDMFQKMYEYALFGDYDMVWCDYYRTDGMNHRVVRQSCNINKDGVIRSFLSSKLIASLCNRLYKRRLQNDTEFIYPVANMNEDFVLSLQIVLKSTRIGYLSEPLYYYYCNPQSICMSFDEHKILHNFKGQLQNSAIIFEVLHNVGLDKTYKTEIECKKCTDKDFLHPLLHEKKYQKLWLQTYPEVNSSFLFNPLVRFTRKIRAFCVLFHIYPLYHLMLKLKRRYA